MNRKEKIIKFYDRQAKKYDAWFEIHNDIFLKELAILKEHLAFREKALEVGIGPGRFAKALKISVGIDPSLEMIKLCQEKGIEAILGVADKLPFKSGKFEQVFFITSLCFLAEVDKAITEAKRVLKNDGVMTIAFIDKDSELAITYQKSRDFYFKHAVFFAMDELLVKMKQFNFKSFKMHGTNFNKETNEPPFDFCVISFRKIIP